MLRRFSGLSCGKCCFYSLIFAFIISLGCINTANAYVCFLPDSADCAKGDTVFWPCVGSDCEGGENDKCDASYNSRMSTNECGASCTRCADSTSPYNGLYKCPENTCNCNEYTSTEAFNECGDSCSVCRIAGDKNYGKYKCKPVPADGCPNPQCEGYTLTKPQADNIIANGGACDQCTNLNAPANRQNLYKCENCDPDIYTRTLEGCAAEGYDSAKNKCGNGDVYQACCNKCNGYIYPNDLSKTSEGWSCTECPNSCDGGSKYSCGCKTGYHNDNGSCVPNSEPEPNPEPDPNSVEYVDISVRIYEAIKDKFTNHCNGDLDDNGLGYANATWYQEFEQLNHSFYISSIWPYMGTFYARPAQHSDENTYLTDIKYVVWTSDREHPEDCLTWYKSRCNLVSNDCWEDPFVWNVLNGGEYYPYDKTEQYAEYYRKGKVKNQTFQTYVEFDSLGWSVSEGRGIIGYDPRNMRCESYYDPDKGYAECVFKNQELKKEIHIRQWLGDFGCPIEFDSYDEEKDIKAQWIGYEVENHDTSYCVNYSCDFKSMWSEIGTSFMNALKSNHVKIDFYGIGELDGGQSITDYTTHMDISFESEPSGWDDEGRESPFTILNLPAEADVLKDNPEKQPYNIKITYPAYRGGKIYQSNESVSYKSTSPGYLNYESRTSGVSASDSGIDNVFIPNNGSTPGHLNYFEIEITHPIDPNWFIRLEYNGSDWKYYDNNGLNDNDTVKQFKIDNNASNNLNYYNFENHANELDSVGANVSKYYGQFIPFIIEKKLSTSFTENLYQLYIPLVECGAFMKFEFNGCQVPISDTFGKCPFNSFP